MLCRDHRGLLDAMFAAGKVGAKLLLMNTGFAKPAFAAVAEREGVDTLVYDIEFSDILGDVDEDIPRYLAWVDERRQPARHPGRVDRLGRRRGRRPSRRRSAGSSC